MLRMLHVLRTRPGRIIFLSFTTVALSALVLATVALAGVRWDPVGRVVCSPNYTQQNPKIISDGSGGAIIAWEDNVQNDGRYQVYCQRVDSTGTRQWSRASGIEPEPRNPYDRVYASNAGTNISTKIQMAPDGAHGAYLTWQDTRTSTLDIYAQRMAANSWPPTGWNQNGNRINDVLANEQSEPQIAADSSGGAVIVWQDFYNAFQWYARALKVNPNGSSAWAGPVAMADMSNQMYPQIIQTQDGSGDFIVVYEYLYDSLGDPDLFEVYAQKISPTGGRLWGAGKYVTTEHYTTTWSELLPQVCSDGGGGAIVTWQDNRPAGTGHWNTYAQKLDSDGNRLAAYPEGIAVSGALTSDESNQKIVPDGSGGAYVVWQIGNNIEANRIDSSGAKMWGDTGVALATSSRSSQIRRWSLIPRAMRS